jgi:hypothetical protein
MFGNIVHSRSLGMEHNPDHKHHGEAKHKAEKVNNVCHNILMFLIRRPLIVIQSSVVMANAPLALGYPSPCLAIPRIEFLPPLP